jgi:hypothetical protein
VTTIGLALDRIRVRKPWIRPHESLVDSSLMKAAVQPRRRSLTFMLPFSAFMFLVLLEPWCLSAPTHRTVNLTSTTSCVSYMCKLHVSENSHLSLSSQPYSGIEYHPTLRWRGTLNLSSIEKFFFLVVISHLFCFSRNHSPTDLFSKNLSQMSRSLLLISTNPNSNSGALSERFTFYASGGGGSLLYR